MDYDTISCYLVIKYGIPVDGILLHWKKRGPWVVVVFDGHDSIIWIALLSLTVVGVSIFRTIVACHRKRKQGAIIFTDEDRRGRNSCLFLEKQCDGLLALIIMDDRRIQLRNPQDFARIDVQKLQLAQSVCDKECRG